MLSSFLLIGQSNMSGRGVLTAENRIFDNRIFRLVNGRWQTMWEPLSADRVFAGASLAPAFALEFVKRTGEQVGLIPASDGGSSIDEWQPGEALYDHAVCQARLAMRISDIKAVLWHQGEADCNPARAAVYAPKFLHMFRTLKKDLQLPEIRIYVGGLGDYLPKSEFDPNLAHYDGINTVLRTLAAENDDIRYVSAEGLAPKDDNLHFNTESLREFGKRYFAAFAADTPELAKGTEAAVSAVSGDENLSEMKAKMERGEISAKEYDAFVHAYIAKL
ncbi:MAG: sialate O-acetylesterase [Eubacteriales bacterium]|jgi:hypothetical protein